MKFFHFPQEVIELSSLPAFDALTKQTTPELVTFIKTQTCPHAKKT